MASRHGLGERRLAGFLAERAEFDFLPDELPDDLGAAETRRIGERSLAITINGVHISRVRPSSSRQLTSTPRRTTAFSAVKSLFVTARVALCC